MIMKLSFAVPSLALSLSASASASSATGSGVESGSVFRPRRFSFLTLSDDAAFRSSDSTGSPGSDLLDALSTSGVVAVGDVPGYGQARRSALSLLHECSLESSGDDISSPPSHPWIDHVFPDGTVRRTLATRTLPGPGGVRGPFAGSSPPASASSPSGGSGGACESFARASDELRSAVAVATSAFAARVGSVLDTGGGGALLRTEDGARTFDSFRDVVDGGHHLEHFHSYRRTEEKAAERGGVEETVELHTDQGLLIAFTPGLMVGGGGAEEEAEGGPGTPSGGFYVELGDGSLAEADLDGDDVIFMLGDGVEQYVNPAVRPGSARLRPVLHSVSVPVLGEGVARAWYGRMVLPPPDAVHPVHGMTFGEVRRLLREGSVSVSGSGGGEEGPGPGPGPVGGIGCSPGLVSRQMEEMACGEDELHCWHRCMNLTEFEVSHEICAESGRRLECINPRDQLWTGKHGDYFPGCTDSTENATDYPKLPSYPRDETACPDAEWEAFSSSGGYDNEFVLKEGRTKFMWTVLGDGRVKARLAHSDIFGFLAFGLAKAGGDKNGMQGASIIMGLPGDNYDAVAGLNLTLEDNVREYEIHHSESAFRHWQEPVPGRDFSAYESNSTDCFTAISFGTDSINGIPFNLSGTDKVLWAANSVDRYAGYHGQDRSVFCIKWSEGEAYFEPERGMGCDYVPKDDTSAAETGLTASITKLCMVLLAGIGLALYL